MQTKITDIADGIYRLSTFVPDIAPRPGNEFGGGASLRRKPRM